MPTRPVMSRRIAGVQFDCLPEFLLGSLPLPAIKIQSESQRGVSLTELIVQCQCLCGSRLGLEKSIARRKDPIFPIARQCVRVSQSRICLGVSWIGLYGTAKIFNCCPEACCSSLVPEVAPF